MTTRWSLTVDCASPRTAGGGRETPWETRWPRVEAEVARLTAAGASVVLVDENEGRPDHVWMNDPEGNDFCVL